jgi:hypothetical protein
MLTYTDVAMGALIITERKTMNQLSKLSLTTIALICLAIALPIGNAVAQEKQHVSYKTSSENSKFIQQLNVDAGDVPNHTVRVFDLHRTHPNGPTINGVKLVEETARGTTDIIDGNGTTTAYQVYMMENGDRFFARLAQVNKNNTGKIAATAIGPITGGTGKFADMHGFVQVITNFDVKSGFSEAQIDIEYWFAK